MPKKSTRTHLRDAETGIDRAIKNLLYGRKPDIIDKFKVLGRVTSQTKSAIARNINGIIKHSDSFKIGKTGDPNIRADKKDYRGSYDKMYLLYKTTSKENVSLMEEYFIKKYMKSHPQKISNKTASRVGKLTSYDGYYYTYIVCR